jgi:outer membrane lipoprotein-sorting protein
MLGHRARRLIARYSRFLAVILIASLSTGAAPEPKLSLPELMQLLSSVEKSQARFVETRHSALLTSPLVLKGTLAYQRPDRMVKHVLSPYDERTTLEAGQLTLENRARNKEKTFAVASAPAAAALVESIRATLAGDLAALRHYYSVQVQGSRGDWTLSLQPQDPQIQELVNSITLSGSGSHIRRIGIEETGGDRSVMEITEASE